MQNRKRWLVTLAAIVAAIALVGSVGAFSFGWPGVGSMGFGMMGGTCDGWDWGSQPNGQPFSNAQAVETAENYIESHGGASLELAEVMVFDNHFYAEARETETGRYAYEFLIDRFNGRVSLEPGPNMMWNEKYGYMGGGMMGFSRGPSASGEMPVSESDAVALAQEYLDRYAPELQAGDHAAAFYGYYTLHTLRDGQIVGMLSVNGYTGAVWLHSWHGMYLGSLGDESH